MCLKGKEVNQVKLKSVFENNGFMPARYTCDAGSNSPEFVIEDVPEGTKSFAMTLEAVSYTHLTLPTKRIV